MQMKRIEIMILKKLIKSYKRLRSSNIIKFQKIPGEKKIKKNNHNRYTN